jgi:hypothetical protein
MEINTGRGYLPSTGVTALQKLSVDGVRVLYKQHRKTAVVKIHMFFNIPDFTSQFIPSHISTTPFFSSYFSSVAVINLFSCYHTCVVCEEHSTCRNVYFHSSEDILTC